MKLGAIEFALTLKDNFTNVMKKASLRAKTSAKKIGTSFKNASLAIKTAWLVIGAVVIKTFNAIIKNTQTAELALARMEQQFKNVGIASEETTEEFQDLANQLQEITGLSNDAFLSSAALAASYNLNKQQLKDLLPALADLTAFTTKTTGAQASMEDSVKLMGFVLEGQIGRLKLLGITMTETQMEMIRTGTRADRLSAFLEAVATNAGGVAAAMRETSTGEMLNFKNAMADISKEIGEKLIPILGKLAKSVTGFIKLDNATEELSKGLLQLDKFLEQNLITQKEYNETLEDYRNVMFNIRDINQGYSNQLDIINETLSKGDKILKRREKVQQLINDALDDTIKVSGKDIIVEKEIIKTEEELTTQLSLLNAEIESMTKNIKEKNTVTQEEIDRLEELTGTQEELQLQFQAINQETKIQNDAFKNLATNVSLLDTIRKNALVTLGEESEAFKIANEDYRIAKEELDAYSKVLSTTTTKTKSLADTMNEQFGTEGVAAALRDTGFIIEDTFRKSWGAAGKTTEQIDEMLAAAEKRGVTILSESDRISKAEKEIVTKEKELNKEVGTEFVKAVNIGKPSRALLISDLSKIKQLMIDSQTELAKLNEAKLEPKSTTWEVQLNVTKVVTTVHV